MPTRLLFSPDFQTFLQLCWEKGENCSKLETLFLSFQSQSAGPSAPGSIPSSQFFAKIKDVQLNGHLSMLAPTPEFQTFQRPWFETHPCENEQNQIQFYNQILIEIFMIFLSFKTWMTKSAGKWTKFAFIMHKLR